MINKIEGPGSIRAAQPVKRTGKTGAAGGVGFSKHLDDSGEGATTQALSGTNPISGILGIQEVDDALAHASRGKMRAEEILDRLENLRLEILTGQISREKLQQLATVVSTRRGEINDPRLIQILDEIDLRAQVELAKLSTHA